MTNSNKLRGRIVEKGYTLSGFSNAMHVSRPSLRKKINGESEFKASEIEKICLLLDLSHSDIGNYFFAHDVSKMETNQKPH